MTPFEAIASMQNRVYQPFIYQKAAFYSVHFQQSAIITRQVKYYHMKEKEIHDAAPPTRAADAGKERENPF